MKATKTIAPLLAVLVIAGLGGAAWAAEGDGPATRPAPPRVHGLLSAISGTTITLRTRQPGEELKTMTVTTDANTKVRIDRENKTLADLKEGMFAGVLGPEGQPAKTIIAFTQRLDGGGPDGPACGNKGGTGHNGDAPQ
jgi:hypothetical protein